MLTNGKIDMSVRGRRAAKDTLFDGFASIAKALSSGRRAEIVELLAQGERSVEEIAEQIEQSIANTSHHLRTLARAGLVSSRRAGTHIHYRLASDSVLELWWAMRTVAVEHVADFDQRARGYLGQRDHIETLTGEELRQRLDRGDVFLVDVRPPAEYAAGHLPGAVNVPPDQLDLLDELSTDRDVVAYCRGPYCVYADDAVRRLQAAGRRAARLADGLPEWRKTGGAIEVGSSS